MTEGSFTAAQMEAITADDGPLGIIAGPGCGKTTGATRFPETMFSTTTLNLWGMGSWQVTDLLDNLVFDVG